MINGGLHGRHGAEEPVEEGETDAEVLVHEPLVVEHPVVDTVKVARPAEPGPHNRHALHPETFDMHAVVQIAEDPEAPAENDPEKQNLVSRADPEEPEKTTQGDQQYSGWDDPFESDIADGDLARCRIQVLFAGPLLLQGTVEKQMVLHMIHAQERDPAAVEQAMQEVTQQLGGQNCRYGPGGDYNRFRHALETSRRGNRAQAAKRGTGQCRTTTCWRYQFCRLREASRTIRICR